MFPRPHLALAAACLAAGICLGAVPRESQAATPPLPKLRIQFFNVPDPIGEKYVLGINNLGQVVGKYTSSGTEHAFLYDRVINANMALDLNDLVPPLSGWVIASANDINDHGAIVGYLRSLSDPNVRRGYVLDTTAKAPVLQLLPDSAWSNTFATGINEFGDVLGKFKNADGTYGVYVYNCGLYVPADPAPIVLSTNVIYGNAINNPVGTRGTQVLGQDAVTRVPFLWTRGQGYKYFTQIGPCGVYSMNDSGTFCGWAQVQVSRTSYENRPMRYNTALQALSGGSGGELAMRINNSGDVVTTYDRLYSDLWGFRSINSLIDPADPNAVEWNSKSNMFMSGLNDRDTITKCGQMFGTIWWADTKKLFLLTPVPAH